MSAKERVYDAYQPVRDTDPFLITGFLRPGRTYEGATAIETSRGSYRGAIRVKSDMVRTGNYESVVIRNLAAGTEETFFT